MARHPHGRIDGPLLGLIAACVTALLSFGILGWFIFKGTGTSTPEPADLTPPPTDIRHQGLTGPGMGRGRGLTLEFTAEDDPTRRVGTLRTGTLDPLPGRHFDAGDLKGELYLEDGRALAIEAPSGKLYMPRDDSLESGTLRGGVRIRLYDPRPDGSPANPATDTPALTALTTELRFDFALSEIETPGVLSVASESVDFEGGDVKVIFNKPRERLELVEVRTGGSLTFRPDESPAPRALTGSSDSSGTNATPTAAPSDPALDPATNPQRPDALATNERTPQPDATNTRPNRRNAARPNRSAAANPHEDHRANQRQSPPVQRTFYRIVCSTDVSLTMGPRVLTGDQLEVWVQLLDNALHDNAFGRDRASASAALIAPAYSPTGSWLTDLGLGAALAVQPANPSASQPATQTQPTEGAPAAAALDSSVPDDLQSESPAEPTPDPVILRWEEGLTLRALDDRPAELERNHVAARMTAAGTGLVQFQDADSGATGRSASLEYEATRRFLTLSGPGRRPVALEMPETGRLDATRVEFALETGVIAVPGAGTLAATDPELADRVGARDLTWSERADFELALNEDGDVTGVLREAWFAGSVEARDGTASLAGEHLAATFSPRPDESGSDLTRIDLSGNARVRDATNGELRGETVTALFAQSQGTQGDPERVVITDAFVEREGSSMTADEVDATLTRSEDDELTVDVVLATGNVRIERPDDELTATADRVRAEALLNRADLSGEAVRVSIGNGTLTGTQVSFDGDTEQVEVFGAGSFNLTDDDAAHLAPGQPALTATWTKQMLLNDAAGTLELTGGVTTIWKPEPLVTNDVTAERVTIEFEDAKSEGDDASPALGIDTSDRTVRRVVAIGGEVLDPNGAPAVVQSLREGPIAAAPDQPQERPVERLLRLEAPEIVANNTEGTIRVDHPGRLVLADLRGAPEPVPSQEIESTPGDQPASDDQPESGDDRVPPAERPRDDLVILPKTAAEPPEPQPQPAAQQDSKTDLDEGAPIDLAPGGLRGSAMFTWQGSLEVDQPSGQIIMKRGVTMNHIRLGDGRRSDLLCDELTAVIATDDPEADDLAPATAPGPLEGAEFERVIAEGTVHLRSGDQEVFADRLIYDAVTGIAEAIAIADNVVTFFDEQAGTPVTASRLWWDLIEGRIEVRRPGSISAPR